MLRVDLVEARLLQRQCSYYHTGLRDLLQGYIKQEQDLSLPGVSHLVRCRRGSRRSERSGKNRLRYVMNQINLCRLFTSVGFDILLIASIFEGSGFSPSLVIMCPINSISAQLNTDLSCPRLIFFSLHLFSKLVRLLSWSRCAS